MIGLYHYIALGLFAGFAAVELLARGRSFPEIPRWKLKGAAFGLLYFAIATYAPLLWDGWLGEHRLFAADMLPLWLQIAGGFLAIEVGIYTWHRTMHNMPVLWRWLHQMHHSAERIDVWGAFYFHPLDMVGWALVGSFALVLCFGVSAEAAIVINIFATFASMFGHLNIKTPHWLGYIIARPESHAAHHEPGVHGRNYSDLPVWDMLFGTFHNPREFKGRVGFYDGASRKLASMLAGREIA